MANSVRELIEEKALKLSDMDSLGMAEASKELVELSSLLATVGKKCSDSRYWYSLKRIELLKEHGTAAKANIYGEGSQEFKGWQEAEGYRKAIIEMIRSIKFYLKVGQEELRNQNY